MTVIVGIIEDDRTVSDHLSTLLLQSPQLRLGGVANNRAQAIGLIRSGKCDVILLDIGLPDVDGLDLVAEIQQATPDAKIIVVTTYSNSKQILRSFRMGVAGYLLKYEVDKDLEKKIIQAYNGAKPVSAEISSHLVKRIEELETGEKAPINAEAKAVEMGLSPREWTVLRLLSEGLPIAGIANRLNLSAHTVNQHLRSIYTKLGVSSRSMAVHVAMTHGLTS